MCNAYNTSKRSIWQRCPEQQTGHLEERICSHDDSRSAEATLTACVPHQRCLTIMMAMMTMMATTIRLLMRTMISMKSTWIGLTPSLTLPTPSTVVTDQPLQANTGTRHLDWNINTAFLFPTDQLFFSTLWFTHSQSWQLWSSSSQLLDREPEKTEGSQGDNNDCETLTPLQWQDKIHKDKDKDKDA